MSRTTIVTLFFVACTANYAWAQGMPQELREHLDEHYIGTWNFTVEGPGPARTAKGTVTVRWSKGDHCILIEQEGTAADTADGKIHTFGVLAWQPDTKTVVHHGFLSNGDYFTITYDALDGTRRGRRQWRASARVRQCRCRVG